MNTAASEKNTSFNHTLSSISYIAGFVSIVASIAIWFLSKDPDVAHGERFGIFVGLWAPTFFILSDRLKNSSVHPGK